MSSTASASRKETQAQLGFRKGSRVIPIILLLLTIALFITYGLPSGFQQLGLALGLIKHIDDPLTLEALQEQLSQKDALANLWKGIQEKKWGFWEYLENSLLAVPSG